MKKFPYIVVGVMMLTPTLAFAQAAAPAGATAATAQSGGAQLGADGKITLAVGTEVLDTQGGKVGTLTKVERDASGQPTNVVLKTGKSEVLIPASSLARTEKNALIAMTAAQIDAAAAAAAGGGAGGSAQAPAGASRPGAEASAAGSANSSSQTN